jgi:hypothetical protein
MEGFEKIRTLKTSEGRLAANFTSFLKSSVEKAPLTQKANLGVLFLSGGELDSDKPSINRTFQGMSIGNVFSRVSCATF